ncbi:MAG: DUF190 domain-containing protein [Actinobacteria bacterium]|nr:MAG: DUF190 domain-containing protein [Actinomycetota bacterium]
MVVRSGPARALLHARWCTRPQGSLLRPAGTGSHEARFDAPDLAPPTVRESASSKIADTAERIERIFPLLDEMVTEGLVTLENAEIIAYRSSSEPCE